MQSTTNCSPSQLLPMSLWGNVAGYLELPELLSCVRVSKEFHSLNSFKNALEKERESVKTKLQAISDDFFKMMLEMMFSNGTPNPEFPGTIRYLQAEPKDRATIYQELEKASEGSDSKKRSDFQCLQEALLSQPRVTIHREGNRSWVTMDYNATREARYEPAYY